MKTLNKLVQQTYEKNCLPINFDLDTEYLYEESQRRPRKKFYYPKLGQVKNYYYAPYEPDWLKDYIKRNFGIKGRFNMKFVYLIPGYQTLNWHTDKGTKCAINWVVNKPLNDAVLEYRDSKHIYSAAIINTEKEHRVTNLEFERILFKVSCFDMTYEELCTKFITRFMLSVKSPKK